MNGKIKNNFWISPFYLFKYFLFMYLLKFYLFRCIYLFIFSGSNCLAGCVFVISDYQECMDHDILDTWMDVSSTLTNTNR